MNFFPSFKYSTCLLRICLGQVIHGKVTLWHYKISITKKWILSHTVSVDHSVCRRVCILYVVSLILLQYTSHWTRLLFICVHLQIMCYRKMLRQEQISDFLHCSKISTFYKQFLAWPSHQGFIKSRLYNSKPVEKHLIYSSKDTEIGGFYPTGTHIDSIIDFGKHNSAFWEHKNSTNTLKY